MTFLNLEFQTWNFLTESWLFRDFIHVRIISLYSSLFWTESRTLDISPYLCLCLSPHSLPPPPPPQPFPCSPPLISTHSACLFLSLSFYCHSLKCLIAESSFLLPVRQHHTAAVTVSWHQSHPECQYLNFFLLTSNHLPFIFPSRWFLWHTNRWNFKMWAFLCSLFF